MNTPCNLPYLELPVDKNGNFVNATQLADIQNFVKTSDLLVMSHGWNNTMDDARDLYQRFFTQFCQTPGLDATKYSVIGILWPSEKFADASEIPGGAAALGDNLEDDPEAQRAYVDSLRAQLPNDPSDEDGMQQLFAMDGADLLQMLAGSPVQSPPPSDDDDDMEGGAQGILSGIRNAALQLANVTTYYIMKNRAGIVGAGAVAQALNGIQTNFPDVRIHLIGHSFGCRLVTSAAATVGKPVASMTLLQAAFSHNSFSPDFDDTHEPGGFRNVIANGKVTGPILISHTIQDKAVGLAYAIASRIARQNASAIGGANDPYGGLGTSGAQKTPEAIDGDLEEAGATYSFAQKIYNLKADTIIMAHSDIVKPEIAYALLQAVTVS
jgi:hypothetical protein